MDGQAQAHAQARARTGREGERLARELLEREGVEILDANWRCSFGELDVVGREGDELVFVEVKTRTSTAFGHPAEAVTPRKVVRLRRLAAAWLQAHDVHARGMRVDVVAVLARPGAPTLVEHLRGVGA